MTVSATASVRSRRRFMHSIAVTAIALAGCATGSGLENAAFLKIDCNVPEAAVWIDDRLAGRVAEYREPRPMMAGFRRLEIRHPGHFTYFREISSRPGDTVHVRAELRAELE
jgi:hypothetical protein